MIDEFPRVGKSEPGHNIYCLDVYDFLKVLDPPAKFSELGRLDPADYFITSGDAIQKSRYLATVLWTYAGNARKILNSIKKPTKSHKNFEAECWKQAGAVAKMIKQLIYVKDTNVFLETEWRRGLLTITPKNPRAPR